MKKTLLSAVASLAVIGSACAAGPDTCNPDKYVWVEKDELCIPKNPCKSKSDVIRNAYCITVFDGLQLPWETAGEWLAEAYIKNVLNTTGSYQNNLGRNATTHLWGNDYMDYKLYNGGYVVFEFDDLMDESAGATASHPLGFSVNGSLKKFRADNAIKGAFLAFGYSDSTVVQDEALCKKIASLATDVFSVTYDEIFRYEMRNGVCEIYLVTTTSN